MSIAGGIDKAPQRAASVACTAMQVFVKNNNRWEGPPIPGDRALRFREELKRTGLPLRHVFAHTCYLINLASSKEMVIQKSKIALEDELRRCEQVGLPGLVMHPGSHLGDGREVGIERLAKNLREVFDRTPDVQTRLLLETTAGTGNNLGGPFEDLADIIAAVDRPKRLGVCLDTCHIFAAGYDIRDETSYQETMQTFSRIVGFKNLRAVHLNDSKMPLDSRKDRHEHIGQGEIGPEAFRLILTDKRFARIPMALETDKNENLDEDRMNLSELYRLAGEEYLG